MKSTGIVDISRVFCVSGLWLTLMEATEELSDVNGMHNEGRDYGRISKNTNTVRLWPTVQHLTDVSKTSQAIWKLCVLLLHCPVVWDLLSFCGDNISLSWDMASLGAG